MKAHTLGHAVVCVVCGIAATMIVFTSPALSSVYGPEYDAAFEAMYDDPTDLDRIFEYAAIARRVGDYEGAIGALERMLVFNPNLPVVHYELARLYAALGSHATARRYYLSALDLAPPDEIREDIEAALAEIARATSASRWSGAVFAGVRWQDNANVAPDGGRVVIGGIDALLDAGSRERSDTSLFVTASLDHLYDFRRDPAVFWLSSIEGYVSHQQDLQRLDLVLVSVDTGPQFHLRDGIILRPFLIADTVALDDVHYYRSFGLGGELTRDSDSLWRWSLDAQALWRDHLANSRFPALNDRDGENYRVGGELSAYLSPNLLFTVSPGLELQASRRGYERWRQGEVRLGLLQALSWPGDDASFHVGVTGSAGLRNYASPDVVVDPGRERRDRQYSAVLSATIPFAGGVGWVVELRRQWQHSNLPNYSWSDLSVSGGMRFSF